MIQAEWGNEKFEITSQKVRSIKSISWKGGIKEKSDTANKTEKVTGDELQTVQLVYHASYSVGLNPDNEVSEWQSLCGKTETLCIGSEIIGGDAMMLIGVQTSDEVISNKGEILSETITLSFIEVEAPNSGKDITVTIAGKDITSSLTIENCVYDMYAESHADVLELRVADPYKQWGDWNTQDSLIDKEITVVSGAVKTGKMFVNSVLPLNGSFKITALSTPKSIMNEESKSWENVTLEDLAQEIADKHGLTLETHGTKGIQRQYVRQDSISDAVFLQKRCKAEGASFLVYDGKLVVFDENTVENASPTKEISADNDLVSFSYTDKNDSRIETLNITNGDIDGTYTDGGAETGIVRKKRVDETVKDVAEANAVAQALCREENKNCATGEILSDMQKDIAAGSVFKLVQDVNPSWNCPVYVYHVRHNFRLNKSTISIRKPLEY